MRSNRAWQAKQFAKAHTAKKPQSWDSDAAHPSDHIPSSFCPSELQAPGHLEVSPVLLPNAAFWTQHTFIEHLL